MKNLSIISRSVLLAMSIASLQPTALYPQQQPASTTQTLILLPTSVLLGYGAKLMVKKLVDIADAHSTDALQKEKGEAQETFLKQYLADNKIQGTFALSSAQKKEIERQYGHINDRYKLKQTAASAANGATGKFLEETMKALIDIEAQQQLGLPKDAAKSLSNAFNVGLKWTLITASVTTGLGVAAVPFIALIYDELTRALTIKTAYAYELEPIKTFHTTAWYCGPKDPYCLHGRPQKTIAEELEEIRQGLIPSDLKPLLATITSLVVANIPLISGIFATNLAYEGSTQLTAAAALIAQTILSVLGVSIPKDNETMTSMLDAVKKSVEFFFQTAGFELIKDGFVSLATQIQEKEMTPKEIASVTKEIKEGGKIRKGHVAAYPAVKKLASDLKSLLLNQPKEASAK